MGVICGGWCNIVLLLLLLLLATPCPGLMVLGHIERLVNGLWDWFDVRVHLLLNAFHVVPVVVRDQIDRQTQVA